MHTQGPIIIVLLFAARLAIPLAITFALAIGYDRLVAYWNKQEAEEQAQAMQARMNAQFPDSADLAHNPCWEYTNCDEAQRAECLAYTSRSNVPCWLAKQLSTGELGADCLQCPVFQQNNSQHDVALTA